MVPSAAVGLEKWRAQVGEGNASQLIYVYVYITIIIIMISLSYDYYCIMNALHCIPWPVFCLVNSI